MKYILSSRVCLPTAKLLRNNLQQITNDRIVVTTNENKIKRNKFLFSYGKCYQDNTLNSPEFILLCSNKLRLSNLLLENNFYTPLFINDRPPNNDEFPVLIRQTLNGHGGEGIIPCSDINEYNQNWRNNYYWTKYINTTFELRVHVFENKIIKIFKKEKENEEGNILIRNVENGYHFALKDITNYPKVELLVNRLNEINGFNGIHYGLDLGYDKVRHEYFIFECNTGCGLNEETAKLYAELIYNRINNAVT